MLGKHYYINLCGAKVNEEGMRQIPRPRLELLTHVTTRTVQSGAFLGTLVVGPLIAVAKGQTDKENMKSWAETAGKYGVGIGLIAGPILTAARLRGKDITDESVWDRCYRLRYNKRQVRVDRLSLAGTIAGVAAASYLGESATMGALVGLNTGILLSILFGTLGL